MTVASIHQNSFVMNVEWSVKFSCSTCTSFLIQNFTNYTVASIYQNSFVVNVKMVSENFLVAHTLLFYNYSHCFFRSMKHLTQASHPYLQRETTTKRARRWWNDVGNRQEKRKKYLHKPSTINQGSYLTIYFFSKRTHCNRHIAL